MQLQKTELAAGVDPGVWQGLGVRRKLGGSQTSDVCDMNTYGVKTGKIWRESTVAVLAIGFFTSAKSSLKTAVAPDAWLILILYFSSMFLAVSIHLSFADLWVW